MSVDRVRTEAIEKEKELLKDIIALSAHEKWESLLNMISGKAQQVSMYSIGIQDDVKTRWFQGHAQGLMELHKYLDSASDVLTKIMVEEGKPKGSMLV